MIRRRLLFSVIAAALVLSAAGCYTVLRHPTGGDVMAGSSYVDAGYRTCADCHADAAYYHPYYRYGSSHHRWNDYYGQPWWYGQDWWWHDDGYYHDDDEGTPGPGPEQGVRHLWGSGGWATKGWGFGSPAAPEGGSRTPPPPPQQSSSGQPSTGQKQPAPVKPDKPETDDDDSKDDGGLWKERKKGF
ncbi:hypothetical protein K8S17_07355 [bacterium]|nr:hypothetical protein [bacterium]